MFKSAATQIAFLTCFVLFEFFAFIAPAPRLQAAEGVHSVITIGQEQQWVVYKGTHGPGKGKRVVLISGDEEYRSEQALTQLGKILARHHGFTCTVLFAIDP